MNVRACNFDIVIFINDCSASLPHADTHLDRWVACAGDFPRLVALRRRLHPGLGYHDSGHAQGIRFASVRLGSLSTAVRACCLPPLLIFGSAPEPGASSLPLCAFGHETEGYVGEANETRAKKFHPYWSDIAVGLLCPRALGSYDR